MCPGFESLSCYSFFLLEQSMFIQQISQFFIKNSISNSSIAIACSGGADSVALVRALFEVSSQFNFKLAIIHVNYHLRGDDSDKDELFVRNLANKLSLPIFVHDSDITHLKNGVEELARTIRYDFFKQVQSRGYEYIAVGHTIEDQAETVLFRLLRGTSPYGIGAMEEVRDDGVIRPMLSISKEVQRKWLIENGYQWREDISNSSSDYKRNLIRNQIFPLFKDINSESVKHIVDFASSVRELNKNIEAIGFESLKRKNLHVHDFSFYFDRGNVTVAEKSAIATILREKGVSFSNEHIINIETLHERAGKEILFPNNWRGYCAYNRLIFYKVGHFLFDTANVKALLQYYNYKKDPRMIRTVKEDDVTMKGNKKFKTIQLLKKKGVPLKERTVFPVIVLDDGTVEAIKINK